VQVRPGACVSWGLMLATCMIPGSGGTGSYSRGERVFVVGWYRCTECVPAHVDRLWPAVTCAVDVHQQTDMVAPGC
jgi:hypothetical protein